MPNVALVSLGCEKNLINSEQMLKKLLDAGWEFTVDAELADLIVINTCGFIDSAKTEAIDTILDASLSGAKIIVTGCLAQRYTKDLLEAMPEVNGLVGVGSFDEIVEAADAVLRGERPVLLGDINAPVSETERVVTTPRHSTYIKIADGCSNRCAYCVIPSLRGNYRSRPMESIVSEARLLAESGTRELIVIAQDVTRYGIELYGKNMLVPLLRRLLEVQGIEWIRLHYLYPDAISDELIELIAAEPRILNYFDIPIQHINDGILRAMNRRGGRAEICALIDKIRAKIPDAVFRTSLITGLPGEGEAEFEELCEFLKEYRLNRVGAFSFSPQDGTPAALMPDRPPEETAMRRAELIMQLQEGIMSKSSSALVGSVLDVICDASDGEYTGRTYADSPGIDGCVRFSSARPVSEGDIVKVKITSADGENLYGEVI